MFVKQALIWGALTSSVLAGLVSVAHAGKTTIIPGTACRQFPRLTTSFPWELGGTTNAPGIAFNSSAAYLNVICPITRDIVGSRHGLSSVRVRAHVPNASQRLGCTVSLLDSNTGTPIPGQRFWAESPVNAAGNQWITWPAMFRNMGTTESGYSIICSVPPRGGIISIFIDEAVN